MFGGVEQARPVEGIGLNGHRLVLGADIRNPNNFSRSRSISSMPALKILVVGPKEAGKTTVRTAAEGRRACAGAGSAN
jgi:hypothetical protein